MYFLCTIRDNTDVVVLFNLVSRFTFWVSVAKKSHLCTIRRLGVRMPGIRLASMSDDENVKLCCITWKTDYAGHTILPCAPVGFVTIVLAFVAVFSVLAFVTGVVMGSRWETTSLDDAFITGADSVGLSSGQKAVMGNAIEKREAAYVINAGGKLSEVCMPGSSTDDSLVLMFAYGDVLSPEPVTCSGTVCLKSDSFVVSQPDSPAEDPVTNAWGN